MLARCLVFLEIMLMVTGLSFSSNQLDAEAILDLSSAEAVHLLCSRRLKATDYVKVLLKRADEIDCLNAYSEIRHQEVLSRAREIDEAMREGREIGPLCGLPVVVKDNIDIEGYHTTAGTPSLENHKPKKTADLVKKLEAAGGIVLGKTKMHELAEGSTTISPYFGPVLNPYKPDHHVGGSSGGTAALIAARGVTAGFCSDTSGSCRVPASLTGTTGFRPSPRGKLLQQCYRVGSAIVPMTTTRDTVGLIARTVADVQLLDKILSDCSHKEEDVSLQDLRIGYPREWWRDIGKEVQPAFRVALEALKSAGAQLIEFDVALMIAEYRKKAPENFTYIYEMPRELSRYLAYHRLDVSLPHLIDRMTAPIAKDSLSTWTYRELLTWPTPNDYEHMLSEVTPKISQLWRDYFENFEFDVMIAPTTPITARPINASEPYAEINGRLESTSDLFSRTAELDCPSEIPGLSIPIGLAENGLPIGIQLHSQQGDDGKMLSIGKAMEAVFPKTPAPPASPDCRGKVGKVTIKQDWDKDALPIILKSETAEYAAERLSVYTFEWREGDENRSYKNDPEHVREEL